MRAVLCPKRHANGKEGRLYPQPDGEHWVCSHCRHIWTSADVAALTKAREHSVPAAQLERVHQLRLEDADG